MSTLIQKLELKNVEDPTKIGIWRLLRCQYMGNYYFENGSVSSAITFIALDKEYQLHKIQVDQNVAVYVICNPLDRLDIFYQLRDMLLKAYRTEETHYFHENARNECKFASEKVDAWLDITDNTWRSDANCYPICDKQRPFLFTLNKELAIRMILILKTSLQLYNRRVVFIPGECLFIHPKTLNLVEGKIVNILDNPEYYVTVKSHKQKYKLHTLETFELTDKEMIERLIKIYE